MTALLWLALLVPAAAAPCPTSVEIREVRGDSLRGVLAAGSTVRVERGYYRCHEVSRGDLAIVQPPGRPTPIIKQVRGLPGDRLAITAAGGLSVDGVELTTSSGAPYRLGEARLRMLRLYVGVIPPDAFLLLGDLPEGSTDASRFGLVSRGDLVGRATPLPKNAASKKGIPAPR